MKKHLLYLTAALCLGLVLLVGSALAAECTLEGDELTVTGVDSGTSKVLAAGYDEQGRMVTAMPVPITGGSGSVQVGKTSAVAFKAFFLSGNYEPVAEAKSLEVEATRVWVAEKFCEYLNVDLSQYAGQLWGFTDGQGLSYHEKRAVMAVVNLKIMQGYPDRSFHPYESITRAEITKCICIVLNSGEIPDTFVRPTPTFADAKGHWAEGFIEYCYAAGVVTSKDASAFDPNGKVTKRVFTEWLHNLAAISCHITENGTYDVTGENDTVFITAPDVNLTGEYNGIIRTYCTDSTLDLAKLNGKPTVYVMQDNTQIVGAESGTEIIVIPTADEPIQPQPVEVIRYGYVLKLAEARNADNEDIYIVTMMTEDSIVTYNTVSKSSIHPTPAEGDAITYKLDSTGNICKVIQSGLATRIWLFEQICEFLNIDLSPFVGQELPFKDCDGLSERQKQIVLAICANEIAKGISADQFAPYRSVTRAQAATLLWRGTGMPGVQGTINSYDDVLNDSWYYSPVTALHSMGILPDGEHFYPNEIITKQDFSDWLKNAKHIIINGT